MCVAGLVFWTPSELVEVMGTVAPDYAAFKVLMQRVEDGGIAVHSAALLLPELFAGTDPGLRHTCLSVPDAGSNPDSRRAWVMHLPWQEQGHKAMLEEVQGGHKRRGGPKKRKVREEGAVGAETTAKAPRSARKVKPASYADVDGDATGCEDHDVGCERMLAVPVQAADVAPSRRFRARSAALAAEMDASPDQAPSHVAGSVHSRGAGAGQCITEAAGADADLHGETAAMRAHGGEATPEAVLKTVARAGAGARAPAMQSPGLALSGGKQRVVDTAVVSDQAAARADCQGGAPSHSGRNRRRGLLDPAFSVDLPVAAAPATPDPIIPAGSSMPGEVRTVAEGCASKSPGLKASKSRPLEKLSLLERLRAGLESDSD